MSEFLEAARRDILSFRKNLIFSITELKLNDFLSVEALKKMRDLSEVMIKLLDEVIAEVRKWEKSKSRSSSKSSETQQ